ncbi:MAG: T9SS type A sorting domain-containing protein, partial [Bacteroidota bacterium]
TNGCITGITSSSFKDATNGDWSLASGSAAIDAGTTIADCSPDISGTIRPVGGAYDMGAYEYTGTTAVDKVQNTVELITVDKNRIIAKVQGLMQIINMNGQLIGTKQVEAGSSVILASGMYIIQMKCKNLISTKKIVL